MAEYQYKAISEIWKVYGERAYPEQSELMWWPSGKGQDMHIDVMAKPLYEVSLEDRKGTELEHMTNEEDVINVVPFTDYASILYLNDNLLSSTHLCFNQLGRLACITLTFVTKFLATSCLVAITKIFLS